MSIATEQRIKALERLTASLQEQGEKDRKLVNALTQQCIDLAHTVDQLVKAKEQSRGSGATRNTTR